MFLPKKNQIFYFLEWTEKIFYSLEWKKNIFFEKFDTKLCDWRNVTVFREFRLFCEEFHSQVWWKSLSVHFFYVPSSYFCDSFVVEQVRLNQKTYCSFEFKGLNCSTLFIKRITFYILFNLFFLAFQTIYTYMSVFLRIISAICLDRKK